MATGNAGKGFQRRYNGEVQQLLRELVDKGHVQPAEVARHLGIKPRYLVNIRNGFDHGEKFLADIRALHGGIMRQVSSQLSSELPSDATGESQPASPGVRSDQTASALSDAPRPGMDDTSGISMAASVDVPDAPPTPGATLREKLARLVKGEAVTPTMLAPAAPKGKQAKADEDRAQNFAGTGAPILALLAAVYLQSRVPDPYKPVAPSQGEIAAILTPPLRIIGRRLEVRGHLNPDEEDLLLCLSAATVVGERSWNTFKAIQAEEIARGNGHDSGGGHQQPGRGHAAPPAGAAGAGGAARAGADARGRGAAGGPAGAVPGQAAGGHAAQAGADAGRRADLLDFVLAADADGRRRLGIN